MSEQRKQIILNEIAFWKKNKLLPEHYCDFLTTLYAQGEVEEDSVQRFPKSILHKKKNNTSLFILILAGIFTAILLTAIFISSYVQIVIGIAILAVLVFLVFAIKQNSSTITSVLLILSALLLLAISFKSWEVYVAESSLALLIILIANCLAWLVAGYGLRLIYFKISGFLGGLVILIYYIVLYF